MPARIDVLAVGSLSTTMRPVFDHYQKLIAASATVTSREVREVSLKGRSATEVLREEGKRLLPCLPSSGVVVALEVAGREYGSEAFAARLQEWFERGGATFVIGGSLGLAPEVSARAHEALSLSRLTMPHQLVRVVLAEQLFRALKIARGETYHH